MHRSCLVLLVFSLACGDDDVDVDGGGTDATVPSDGSSPDSMTSDAGVDAPSTDGGSDGGVDAAIDAGPRTWMTPRGLPTPEFGVEETVDATCGELTSRAFTDVDDLEDLPAGSIVEIPAGTYEASRIVISGAGTPCQPIFVRGAEGATPVLRAEVRIAGSYIIVEGLDIDLSANENHRVGFEDTDHAVLRHSEVHGLDIRRNTTVVFLSGASHTVIWNNHIHDNGDFAASGEIDVHGIGAGGSWDIWIVDNHIHHNRGDGMQFGHRAGNTLGRIYVGRNDIHDNGENSVDIKEASDVIVSENVLHDDTAGNVVFHDCPLNAALIYNEVSGSDFGVSLPSLEDACAGELPVSLFVLGNSFDDARQAIQGWGSGKRYFIAANEFGSGVDEAIAVDPISGESAVSEDESAFEAGAAAFQAYYGRDIR